MSQITETRYPCHTSPRRDIWVTICWHKIYTSQITDIWYPYHNIMTWDIHNTNHRDMISMSQLSDTRYTHHKSLRYDIHATNPRGGIFTSQLADTIYPCRTSLRQDIHFHRHLTQNINITTHPNRISQLHLPKTGSPCQNHWQKLRIVHQSCLAEAHNEYRTPEAK